MTQMILENRKLRNIFFKFMILFNLILWFYCVKFQNWSPCRNIGHKPKSVSYLNDDMKIFHYTRICLNAAIYNPLYLPRDVILI